MTRQRLDVEVGMEEGVFGAYALVRAVDEKELDELDGLVARVGHELVEGNGLVEGKLDLVVVGQLGEAGPCGLAGRAESAYDQRELLDVRVAGEERTLVEQLAEYAADGPQVDALVVLARAVEELGRSVPARGHLGRVQAIALVLVEDARESEVADLEVAGGADEQIGRLQVAMHDRVLVAEGHAVQQHLHVALDLGLGDGRVAVAYHLGQVAQHELEDEHEARALGEHVEQLDDVLVLADRLQRLDLAQHRVGYLVLEALERDALERHDLAALDVLGLEDDAVRALAHPAKYVVVVHIHFAPFFSLSFFFF